MDEEINIYLILLLSICLALFAIVEFAIEIDSVNLIIKELIFSLTAIRCQHHKSDKEMV